MRGASDMSVQRQRSSLLLGRGLLVLLAGFGFALSMIIGFAKPFGILSYFVSIPLEVACVIIFGWACYVGYRHEHDRQILQ